MALKTTLEQLEELQAAITKVIAGQEVTIDGMRITRANLKDMTDRETMLLARYKNERGTGGMTINVGIPRRDY